MKLAQSQISNYISVAIPAPLYGVFDYTLDSAYSSEDIIGARVLVRFGNRSTIGIVTGQKSTTTFDPSKIKPIESMFNERKPFDENLIHLLLWASSYYGHPIGECFNSAMPTALKKPQVRPNYEIVRWQRTAKVFVGRRNALKQIALLETVEKSKDGIWEDSLKSMGFPAPLIKRLYKEGYLDRLTRPLTSKAMQVQEDGTSYRLNKEQLAALDELKQASGFRASLLEGVTGSGKTEVYIAFTKHILAQKKQTLILVPEINLTPQTFRRFQSQLGIPVAVYHSGMSEKEKLITYALAQSGEARVVIGTRSSVFLPFQELGLIVVDEEHDTSYKQAEGFKYSARDLAVKRAQLFDCPILLGSATPSGETLANARSKRFAWLKLDRRANASAMPSVLLEDMRPLKKAEHFSPRVLAAIKKTIDDGNQAIIFQNRRGFAPSLMCFDCGWLCDCPSCDAKLTVHLNPPHLHCHHCDYKSQMPPTCPNCGGHNTQAVGAGTERLEHTLNYYFPNTPCIRIDRDQIKSQKDLEQILDQINTGAPAIIVGTQMLAKGHDFPNVTLVVVTDADGLFFSSDFRALERGAQQLLQVAGRTGRGDKPGRVIIQTRQPEHEIFEHICAHNYRSFMDLELEVRRACSLPPFSKMLSVRAESRSDTFAANALADIKSRLSNPESDSSILIAGPMPAPITRKQNTFRYLLHIFSPDTIQRAKLLSDIVQAISENKDRRLKLSIDVDPLEFN